MFLKLIVIAIVIRAMLFAFELRRKYVNQKAMNAIRTKTKQDTTRFNANTTVYRKKK